MSSSVTPVPIHADSTSFQMPAVQPSPIAANTFAVKDNSFPLRYVNTNASDGEPGHINLQSTSTKPRARHSLLKELSLALLSELTPRKRNFMNIFPQKQTENKKLENSKNK